MPTSERGEMEQRVRAFDWSKTPLGPMETWSPALRTMTSILLANRFPMLLWWGPDSISVYNDAYVPVLGAKHPAALGQPVREVWSEIHHVLEPLIVTPLTGGPPTWSEDLLLEIRRHGFLEETHWTVAYSPVPDDTAPNGIGGVIATVHEITAQVVGKRRNELLLDLARARDARSVEEACAAVAAAFERAPADVAFALIYVRDDGGDTVRLAAQAGAVPEHPDVASLGELAACFSADRTLTLPIDAGALVIGPSPRLELDAAYRTFLDLAAAHLASAIANARAYDLERSRADALTELDRAKTAFLGNVSHELRTPLTLILGHVADTLETALSPEQRAQQEAVQRSALRLLKLVNSLLDFSRIEAGRAEASYRPTDLGALTAETASAFRSLIEGAGLRLDVALDPIAEPVFVDRQMWEQIVLNLLSNAFKFTRAGSITVRLTSRPGEVRLDVSDTGSGIDGDELPRIFERFYRANAGASGRTYEGTGIGLALVRELARLHGGTATVTSRRGEGSTFSIAIPTGSAHLPPERIDSSNRASAPAIARTVSFLEEAAAWGDTPREAAADLAMQPQPTDATTRLLVADDNADMRAYLERLLRPLGTIELARDGREALAAIRRSPPDLVLSDVMMPGLDGLALVRAIRGDPAIATIPTILLSARAGEESRVDGASTGADDYVVKPFSARELIARVRAQLVLARLRREHAEHLRAANAQLAEADQRKNEFLAMLSHELRNPLSPIVTGLGLLKHMEPGDPRAARTMEVVERQVAQLASLVNDLLDMTRITRNAVELHPEPLELNEVVRLAVEDNLAFFEAARVRVDIASAAREVALVADRARLRQVVGNLLHNAARFTPPGGHARVAVGVEGREAVLRVIDDGIGMAPEDVARLFLPFVQAEQTLDRSKGGLGLAVVKRLVELHGGTVAARSEGKGRGAELVVRLPLAEPPPVVATPSGRPPPTVARRVLVVEDNVDAAELLGQALELRGHAVAITHNGLDALDEARRFRPDVVLCDIGLPGMSGYEIARAFHADEALRDAYLVALSGYAQPDDVRRATDAGFDRHLAKPPAFDTLERILASL